MKARGSFSYPLSSVAARLERAVVVEGIVAAQLRRLGFAVLAAPVGVRGEGESPEPYASTTDLWVRAARVLPPHFAGVTGGWSHLEVKSRPGLRFSSAEDYPFETAYLMSDRAWRAKSERPPAVLIYSGKTGVTLAASTAETAVLSTPDPVRGIRYDVRVAPRSALRPLGDLGGLLASATFSDEDVKARGRRINH